MIVDGWYKTAKRIYSPNFNDRPNGEPVSLLVVHNISLPPGEFGGGHIQSFFQNRLNPSLHPYFETIKDLQVSAHCLIARDGAVFQFVSFKQRAWHAGASCFNGRENCNDFSIGIELEGTDDRPYEPAQYHSLTLLTRSIMTEYPAVTSANITGHCDIAPGRKTDPGDSFNWDHFQQMLTREE